MVVKILKVSRTSEEHVQFMPYQQHREVFACIECENLWVRASIEDAGYLSSLKVLFSLYK